MVYHRRSWRGLLAVTLVSSVAWSAATVQEGLKMPAFAGLSTIQGPSVDLKSLTKDNGAVIAVVSARQEEGRRLLDFLQLSDERFKQLKVGTVVLVTNAGVRDTVASLVRVSQLTIPVSHDAGNALSRAWGATSGATALVVKHDGTIYKRIDLGRDAADVGPLAFKAAQEMVTEEDDAKDRDSTKPDPKDKGKDPPKPDAGPTPPATPTLTDDQLKERVRLGVTRLQMGYTAAAAEDARAIAQLRPDSPLALLWLGYTLEALANYPEAVAVYRALLKADPTSMWASAAIQRIDPYGRWLATPAPLPAAKPATPAPTAPTAGQGAAVVK